MRLEALTGTRAARKDELPALTPQQIQKLRKLTVVTLAHRHKVGARHISGYWLSC